MADPNAAPNATRVDQTDLDAQSKLRVQQELNSASPAASYAGLQVSPDLVVEFEENQAAPIDGSNSLLRKLSPFIIQVEPPLVFGSEPLAVDQNTKGKGHTGLYGAALRSRSGFSNARAALANTTFVRGNIGVPGGGPEEVALGNSRSSGGSRNKSGSRKTDASGKADLGKLGEPALVDLKAAIDITMQLRTIIQTPPLVLLINPQSLSISHTKIQQYSDRTRFGYIFQAWGEEQPKLSIEARCGAFISGGRGVQFASRRDSAAWQNLMTAFQFYRNNGYIYDTVGKSNAHHFVGALSIRYDQWIYTGHMESFSFGLDETGTQLGGVTFSMEFVVSSMVDTATQPLNVTAMRKFQPSFGDPGQWNGVVDPAFNPPGTSLLDRRTITQGTSSTLREENGTRLVDPDVKPQETELPVKGPPTTSVRTNKGGFRSPPDTETAVATAAPDPRLFRFTRGL